MLSISLCSRSLLASHEEVLLNRHAVREGTPDKALRTLAYERAIHLGELREDTRELSQLACAYPPSGWEASSLSSAQGTAAEDLLLSGKQLQPNLVLHVTTCTYTSTCT